MADIKSLLAAGQFLQMGDNGADAPRSPVALHTMVRCWQVPASDEVVNVRDADAEHRGEPRARHTVAALVRKSGKMLHLVPKPIPPMAEAERPRDYTPSPPRTQRRGANPKRRGEVVRVKKGGTRVAHVYPYAERTPRIRPTQVVVGRYARKSSRWRVTSAS